MIRIYTKRLMPLIVLATLIACAGGHRKVAPTEVPRVEVPKIPTAREPEPSKMPLPAEVDEGFKDPFTNMEFVFVPGGTFEMGDIFGVGSSWEKPVHTVTLSDFYIGRYEVTQAEWEMIRGENPSAFKGSKRPVENVSWNDIQEFIKTLNQKTGQQYRLPTEAEWEYAARSGGNEEKWAGTSNASEVNDYSWHKENSGNETHNVGEKMANGLGIYDMSGNVYEWCSDYWYRAYPATAETNPTGPGYNKHRVLRGGSFLEDVERSRTMFRAFFGVNRPNKGIGFRLALSK